MAAWDNAQLPQGPTPASYGGRLVDFSGLGNLYGDYAKGQLLQQQLNLQNLFRGGLPTDAQGNIDQNEMITQYLKAKGAEGVPPMLQQLLRQRAISANEAEGQAPFMPAQQPAESTGGNVSEAGTSETEPRAAPVRQALEGLVSAVPDSGPNAGRNIAPEVNAAAAPAGRLPGSELVPPAMLARGVTPQAYADYADRQARNYALYGNAEAAKTWQARAEGVRKLISQAAEIPPEAKLAAREGMSVPEYQGTVKAAEGLGTATGKRVGEVVEAGGLASRHALNTLNTMEQALIRGGRNISTGPGAEQWLKVKQAANNQWPGLFKGVPESETVQKLNAQLAAEAAKAMTARPSQLEFKAFMSNNPGLLTSVAGSKVLISVLRQAREQDIKLSKLAMDPKNLRNWSAVEDQFYQDNPIVGPWAQIGKNPKTGERVMLNGGRWIPIPK